MAQYIEQMRVDIERGESLTRVANKSGLFTPLVMQMIAVGIKPAEWMNCSLMSRNFMSGCGVRIEKPHGSP